MARASLLRHAAAHTIESCGLVIKDGRALGAETPKIAQVLQPRLQVFGLSEGRAGCQCLLLKVHEHK